MFDSTAVNRGNSFSSNNSIKINAVSGAIVKNHTKSWFERFHLGSKRAASLLCEGGHKKIVDEREYKRVGSDCEWVNKTVHKTEEEVIVLQMIVCGDMEVIAECLYRKDFEIVENT